MSFFSSFTCRSRRAVVADDGEPRRAADAAVVDVDGVAAAVVVTRAALLSVEIVPLFSTPVFGALAVAAVARGFVDASSATFGTVGARFGALLRTVFDAAIAASRRALAS